jgi:RNA polymerase sigma factor (sigma-70 family)
MTTEELIESCRPLALRLALKFANNYPRADFNEFVSAGLFGLWQAAQRFRPELGKRFFAFAYAHIQGRIMGALRVMRRRWRELPLSDGDFDFAHDDRGPERFEARDDAEAILKTMHPKYRRILRLAFGLEGACSNQTDVGAAFGVSRERGQQYIHAALRNARKRLGLNPWRPGDDRD